MSLGLTVDTIRQVPERSHEEALTPAVVQGKEIWERNHCMGCHTLLGEGAYDAPELTKVVERRGKPWIRVFLKDPQAMFRGERKMVQYDFSEEIESVIASLGGSETSTPMASPPTRTGGPSLRRWWRRRRPTSRNRLRRTPRSVRRATRSAARAAPWGPPWMAWPPATARPTALSRVLHEMVETPDDRLEAVCLTLETQFEGPLHLMREAPEGAWCWTLCDPSGA